MSPVTTGIGVIELHICGILMDNNGKWSVCFPFIGKEKLLKSEQNSDKKDKEIENNDTLTPVADAHKQKTIKEKKSKKSKKNKQNEIK